jgi:hypothetical protein
MPDQPVFLKESSLNFPDQKPGGEFIAIDGQEWFRISRVDQMPPFFMSLVSHSDHWMFIASNGGLTAGRRNEDNALFPYYTDDKIIATAHLTGSKTLVRLNEGDRTVLWLPFSDEYRGLYRITRNLCKNRWGNALLFEEVNEDLRLTFQYSWSFSESFGFVKKSRLSNHGDRSRKLEIIDGAQNILPSGISSQLQLGRSNLANAYKRNELDSESGIGIFALSAMIVDKPEPGEALKATIGWSAGLDAAHILLSSRQLDHFIRGGSVTTEEDVKGEPGAYFTHAHLNLDAGISHRWYTCFEINTTQPAIRNLIRRLISDRSSLIGALEDDLGNATRQLRSIVAKADGLQGTADRMTVNRHYSNVLFNVMRGGIFEDDYRIQKSDFLRYAKGINQKTLSLEAGFFEHLPETTTCRDLISYARENGHPDVRRICWEYLPLSFSRRHGDPSRPWNKFSIELTNADGTRRKAYAGNWRDIFQNWEALALSYPGFIEGMIFKFLNASTIDGYNPYRISESGVEWEVIEPDDPWSYIGYWGDHQLIYLLKLLEVARAHRSFMLSDYADLELFVYSDVPYRIRPYSQIAANPRDTIVFDSDREQKIAQRVDATGADGKLVHDRDGRILKSGLLEKLFIPWLAKLTNLIPEAGIWLNTQRPEWNDANNALVGYGTSMVTLYYMRRYTHFLREWIREEGPVEALMHGEVCELMHDCTSILAKYRNHLAGGFDNAARKAFADEMGAAATTYRAAAYRCFGGEKRPVKKDDLLSLLEKTMAYLDQSIGVNRRADQLYHAYNLISFEGDELRVDHLYEMLEGQVAVLSSGYLDPAESLRVLDALKSSRMYREDQQSYLLYPNRELPGFLQKNRIPTDQVASSGLIRAMIERGDIRVIETDIQGGACFNGSLHNGRDLKTALDEVKGDYPGYSDTEFARVEEVFEALFNHRAFTGRSGTFFAYEGLGSIYWHMVSKLLLAVQEIITGSENMNDGIRKALVRHYYEIREGLGIHKSPDAYGAFPGDPYSHTPFHRGAQQPGMTGQVKEDILNRWAELGVKVIKGCICFEPSFLEENEWLGAETQFQYVALDGSEKTMQLQKGQLAFTYCQVPVVYQKGGIDQITVNFNGGKAPLTLPETRLGADFSALIFNRSHDIAHLVVEFSTL